MNNFNVAHLGDVEVKARKKEASPRKTSFSYLMTPEFKLTKKETPTLHKVRIKSSLSEMSKNFVQTKIDLQNFL
jgi:hypothetical protein